MEPSVSEPRLCLSQFMRWKGTSEDHFDDRNLILHVSKLPRGTKSPRYDCWGLIRFLIDAEGYEMTSLDEIYRFPARFEINTQFHPAEL